MVISSRRNNDDEMAFSLEEKIGGAGEPPTYGSKLLYDEGSVVKQTKDVFW